MARWKPDARERLMDAAVELFSEQGFAATTVPQITERAGLTTRTFFRHFADKREVIFGDEDTSAQVSADLAQAPPGLTTAEFIAWGLALTAQRFAGHRDKLRVVQVLIDSDEHLRERALRKREMLTTLLAEALRHRGLAEQRSRLLAEAAVSALYAALDQWLNSETDESIDALALKALADLREDLDGLNTARLSARTGRPGSRSARKRTESSIA
jgi:AcrR family transcriptional regulator